MGATVKEGRELDATEEIPVEIRANVEANCLFDALRSGDYASAAKAQERLRSLGWHLTREPARAKRAGGRKPSLDAVGRGVPAR